MLVYELFFGRTRQEGRAVTDSDWNGFRDRVISTDLPNGYTVLDAGGAWASRRTGQTISERTKVVIVALPDRPDSLTAVNAVRSAYRVRFNQQSVGMIVQPACASF